MALAPSPPVSPAAFERQRREDLTATVAVTRERAERARSRSREVRSECNSTRGHSRAEVEGLGEAVDVSRALRTLPRQLQSGGVTSTVDLDVWVLHVRYARTGHATVRAQLVEEYRGYASALARRLHREGEPLEDLVQVALEALLLALHRFEPERSLPFPAFATPTIVGSLKRHYRDLGWAVRVPRRIHEIAAPAREVADRLTLELGRSPTVAEVATELGVEEDTLLEAQEATHARSVSSLDAPAGEDGTRMDLLGAVDPGMGRAENRVALAQALGELTERDRELLDLYFFEELTQTEIAGRYGVSQMQVSRWLTAAIRRLRSRMPAD